MLRMCTRSTTCSFGRANEIGMRNAILRNHLNKRVPAENAMSLPVYDAHTNHTSSS